MLAENYFRRRSEYGTVRYEVDDLVQESYFALLDAVKYYKPGEGAFITFLGYTLKNAFARVNNSRYGYSKTDAIHHLNDETEDTFLETIPAKDSVEEIIFDKLYIEDLHKCMENALKTLPPEQENIIRALYYKNIPASELAQNYGCTVQNINAHKSNALNQLKDQQKENGLEEYLSGLISYHTKVGVKEFKNSHISAVEKIVLKREELTQKWLKKHYGKK